MKPRDLSLLVLHVSSRCDQTCAHCSVWEQGPRSPELGAPDRIALLREARELGAQRVLLTGGEPLLCNHIETLVRSARSLSMRVQIATNGLGLARCSPWLALVDEVYVSLEGPEEIHDQVRGASMFSRLQNALSSAQAVPGRPRLIGRTVVTRVNAGSLVATVAAARRLGLDALSFLPVDVSSRAFGGKPESRRALALSPGDAEALKVEIGRLISAGDAGSFVLENARNLRLMAERLTSGSEAPRCNAPEWSSVVEADGSLRPCFFQPAVSTGQAGGLRETRQSEAYAMALAKLGRGNETCAVCVCPKYVAGGLGAIADRAAAFLSRVAWPRERSPA